MNETTCAHKDIPRPDLALVPAFVAALTLLLFVLVSARWLS